VGVQSTILVTAWLLVLISSLTYKIVSCQMTNCTNKAFTPNAKCIHTVRLIIDLITITDVSIIILPKLHQRDLRVFLLQSVCNINEHHDAVWNKRIFEIICFLWRRCPASAACPVNGKVNTEHTTLQYK